MKLSLENLSQNLSWKGYRLPQYDIQAARDYTKAHPVWLHFGAGNLFRAFPAVLAQRLLTARLSRAGVICCEGYDEELIDRCYRSCDHLSIVATVYPNGTVNKEVVASVTESLKMSEDEDRLRQIFTSPDLQMVSSCATTSAIFYPRSVRISCKARKLLPRLPAASRHCASRAPAPVLHQSRWFRSTTARTTATCSAA